MHQIDVMAMFSTLKNWWNKNVFPLSLLVSFVGYIRFYYARPHQQEGLSGIWDIIDEVTENLDGV